MGFFGSRPSPAPFSDQAQRVPKHERVPRTRAKVAIYFNISVVSRHRKGVLDIAYLLGNEIPGVSADDMTTEGGQTAP